MSRLERVLDRVLCYPWYGPLDGPFWRIRRLIWKRRKAWLSKRLPPMPDDSPFEPRGVKYWLCCE